MRFVKKKKMHTHENDKITMLQIYYHMGDEMERSGNPSQAQVALGCKPLPHQRPIDTIVSSVSHESATLLSWQLYIRMEAIQLQYLYVSHILIGNQNIDKTQWNWKIEAINHCAT